LPLEIALAGRVRKSSFRNIRTYVPCNDGVICRGGRQQHRHDADAARVG
jgi:hypothetical protein